MANIVLAGFDEATAKKLTQKLRDLRHQPQSFFGDVSLLGCRQAELIILSGDDFECHRALATLKSKSPRMPIIIVSRAVDDSLWLSALEAGATDYCSVDVDPANLDWMLNNALEKRAFAGAA